ncbi:conserved hypothetical protein [Talaromyces stipitatus ATCC 10500]|uniref:Uncharacterized protein n=1 Tax=Talaromyces stipitatus (strain ATCC 10500 / CBS 375.48 / QM 6759 / NRRL 1006) TaxID=441959 RepID=B8LTQ4_TALSN|nr:uncharacterized protein TSTA_070560 [Talaromyces stipitatus ATCC 10500]EED23646.1 conserved hypothetical protein [Talaromyces stipitatus ATCC 10500]
MAATLRRTFRYPGDDDESHYSETREELDEQEQEDIIKNLTQKNETDNRFYHTVFTVVPLIAIIAYIPGLFSSLSTAGQRLIYLSCISSFLATAYIMESSTFSRDGTVMTDLSRWLSNAPSEAHKKNLIIANSALCALLALGSLYTADTVLYLLPGILLAITSLARRVITEVDVGELEKLRYEYKGA